MVLCSAASIAQTVTLTTSNYNGYNVSCFGSRNGSITATVTGGTPPYTYEWSNGGTTATINGLGEGYYSVVIDDANTLTPPIEAELTLTQPDELRIQLTPYLYPNQRNISCYGCSNGSITNVVTGGITPYTYLWQPANITVQSPNNLGAGDNTVVVTDANNCQMQESRNLSQPDRSDWTMTGNTGTNPATQFIGTTDNIDFSIRTYNQERLLLKANGEVKVNGLASPAKALVYADENGVLMTLAPDPTTGPATPTPWYLTGNKINDQAHYIGPYNNQDFIFKTGDAAALPQSTLRERMRITKSGDFKFTSNKYEYLGVGTTTQLDFEIKGKHSNFFVTDNSTTPEPPNINLKNNNGLWHFSGPRGETGNPLSIYWNASTRVMSFTDQGTVLINVDPNNLTGIWQNYKLLVDGNVWAEEVRVKLNTWPDYVFANDYKLKSLEEVEAFINKNKHLPGFSSAQQMETEGQNIGQVQVQQQESLEQLYLHVIALEKRIAELEKENVQLKKDK